MNLADNTTNDQKPASLYEEGDQLHKKSNDPGYTMNPSSQGYHGQRQKDKDHEWAENLTKKGRFLMKPVVLAGAGLLLVLSAVLAFRYRAWDSGFTHSRPDDDPDSRWVS